MGNNEILNKTRKKLIYTIMAVVELFMIFISVFIYSYLNANTINKVKYDLNKEYERIIEHIYKYDMDFLEPVNPKNIVYIYKYDELYYYTQNRYIGSNMPVFDKKYNDKFIYENIKGYNFKSYCNSKGPYSVKIIKNIDSEVENKSNLIALLLFVDNLSLVLIYIIAKYIANKALEPIEKTWDNQVKFIQDASHELRTPISIVLSKLEIALKNPDAKIEDEAENLAVAMRESRQIKKMISELLKLTKEDAIVKLNIDKTDLEVLITDLCESLSEVAEFQDKDFIIDVNMEDANIQTDKERLRQLIRIFVDNAIKYTSAGDKISVRASEKGSNVIVSIEDTGIGISKEDQKHIFDRFFRSDSVRSTDIEGSGIGLSIAYLMASSLNAKINVKSDLGKGTTFDIVIPRKCK